MSLASYERRHEELRGRLRTAVARRAAEAGPPAELDVVVSAVEVCDRHGAGVLTRRIFGEGRRIVSVRSTQQYGGAHAFGVRDVFLAHEDLRRTTALANVLAVLDGCRVRRIVCIPYFPDDFATGIALKEISGAPLCTYVMDDNNLDAGGVPDELMAELLARSDVAFAISHEMRLAYERKFGRRVWFLPPLVAPHLVHRGPPPRPIDPVARGRGAIVGNIWARHWLKQLRATVRGTGIELDWYCNGNTANGVSASKLAADGIHLRPALPEDELTRVLRRTPYVVLPSGTLDELDTRRSIARVSFPSRIPYVFATSLTPTLVIGHPDTTAARFVRSRGVGLSIPYARERFVSAVAELTAPDTQGRMRARAAELAPIFSAEGAEDWLWRSLQLGRPADDRWEHLCTEGELAC